MGTFVTVRVDDAPRPGAAIEAAFAAVSAVDILMGCHDPSSELSRLNRLAHREAIPVHPWTFAVFRLALALFRRSSGAFDCAIGGRQLAAGRLPAHSGEKLDADASSADIELPGTNRVRYRRKLHADFGGIAKGFAVDRAVAALRRAGATAGAVNAGGDLRAFGAVPEPVHIRLPLGEGLAAVGEIREAAVATSIAGDDPPLGLPILDAASGRRAAARVVSVFARSCALADALTKVVALQGVRSGPLLARLGAEALWRDRHSDRWVRIGMQT